VKRPVLRGELQRLQHPRASEAAIAVAKRALDDHDAC
jgi:hypothetical protein